MKEKPPEATHLGDLKISDMVIPCAVLEDGRRVITHDGLFQALGVSEKELEDFLYIMDKKLELPKPATRLQKATPFLDASHGVHIGHPPELLTEICQAYLAARDAGLLTPEQQRVANRCVRLLRGLALVGISALIGETTGYQRDKDRHALHAILQSYLDKDLVPWARRFPEEFWGHLFRLMRWQFSPLSLKRPSHLGKLVDQLVFNQLPTGILEELKQSSPEESADIGNRHLERQIIRVMTLMQVSANWRGFESLFARAHPKSLVQENTFSKGKPQGICQILDEVI